jgi:nucleoside-triphosphatase
MQLLAMEQDPTKKFNSTKILLTGLPGCGKTTAIIIILANIAPRKIAGFYTQEIRENNTRTRLGEAPSRSRKGFNWTRLDGKTGILAHIDIKGPYKVGKYGVDIAGFEKSIVPVLDVERNNVDLFIIDEIGKMECFSKKFVSAIRLLFSSNKSLLATVAKKGKGLISEIKNHPDTKIFNLTTQNRDKIIAEISQILKNTKPADTGIKSE